MARFRCLKIHPVGIVMVIQDVVAGSMGGFNRQLRLKLPSYRA